MDQSRLANSVIYKGLVLECQNDQFHVLTNEGELFTLTYRPGHFPGEQIYFFEEDILVNAEVEKEVFATKPIARGIQILGALAAAIALFFLSNIPIGGGTFALMSIDINPSVELELNRSGHIRNVLSINEDGKSLIEALQLKDQSYEDALNLILAEAKRKGYEVDSDSVLIAIAPVRSEGGELVEKMKARLRFYAQEHRAELLIGTEEDAQVVLKNKTSLGRALLGKEHPEVNSVDLNKKSIKELNQQLKIYHDDQDDLDDLKDLKDQDDQDDENDDHNKRDDTTGQDAIKDQDKDEAQNHEVDGEGSEEDKPSDDEKNQSPSSDENDEESTSDRTEKKEDSSHTEPSGDTDKPTLPDSSDDESSKLPEPSEDAETPSDETSNSSDDD